MSLVLACGCASLTGNGPVPDEVLRCRELTRHASGAVDQGDLQEADSLLKKAIAACPADVDARRELARVLWQRGEQRSALIQMEAAVRLAPRDAALIAESGQMLLAEGQIDRAMARAQQAIVVNGRLAAGWRLRARVHRELGDWEQCRADLCRALSFAPQSPQLLYELADLQLQHGAPQRCLTTLQQLLRVYAPGEEPQQVLHMQGLAHAAVGRDREALESLYAASRRRPPRADLLYQVAELELRVGRADAARSAAAQALAIDAGHDPSRELLARLAQTLPSPAQR